MTDGLLPLSHRLPRDPLAAVAVSTAPIALEGQYRLLVGALVRLRRSRRGRWALAAGTGALGIALGLLAVRHFSATSWPLANGRPSILIAAGLLLLLAQGLKAYGWGRLFVPAERPKPLALAAGNGGAAVIGLVLPGRFDDATRVAVVRRYPGCPAGIRVLCLSLVMLGLIDAVALAPLAIAAAALPTGGIGVRLGLGLVALAGIAAAALILALRAALGVFSGAAILLVAILWRVGVSLNAGSGRRLEVLTARWTPSPAAAGQEVPRDESDHDDRRRNGDDRDGGGGDDHAEVLAASLRRVRGRQRLRDRRQQQ